MDSCLIHILQASSPNDSLFLLSHPVPALHSHHGARPRFLLGHRPSVRGTMASQTKKRHRPRASEASPRDSCVPTVIWGTSVFQGPKVQFPLCSWGGAERAPAAPWHGGGGGSGKEAAPVQAQRCPKALISDCATDVPLHIAGRGPQEQTDYRGPRSG